MSTNYTSLVNNIKSTSGRTDAATIAAIPQFIAAAQAKLDNRLRIAEMLVETTYPADALSVPLVSVLELSRVTIAGSVAHQTTLTEVIRLRHVDTTEPLNLYAMEGKALELIVSAEMKVNAFEKPLRISQTNQTNAYTDGAENALLWLSLSYLGVFARDSDATQAWMQLANNEIDDLNESYQAYAVGGAYSGVRHEYF